MDAFLLTAGLGERLRPLTNVLAKPAVPLLGAPMMSYGLECLHNMGVRRVFCNLHHLPDTIRAASAEWLRRHPEAKMKIEFSDERSALLGSAGGLRVLENRIQSDPFLFLNGDEVLVPREDDCWGQLLESHERSGAVATLALTGHPDLGKRFNGVRVGDDDLVRGFIKKPFEMSPNVLHFTGLIMMSRSVFGHILPKDTNILHETFVRVLSSGQKVGACRLNVDWFETGSPVDLQETESKLTLLTQGLNDSPQRHFLLQVLSPWAVPR